MDFNFFLKKLQFGLFSFLGLLYYRFLTTPFDSHGSVGDFVSSVNSVNIIWEIIACQTDLFAVYFQRLRGECIYVQCVLGFT